MQLITPDRYDYTDLYQGFSWDIPRQFNIGTAASRFGHTDPDRIALYYENDSGAIRQYTFGQLLHDSNRLANVLLAKGVKPGDRVGIVLPQRFEAGVAHLAVYRIGAIALPLSVMFGEDALSYRLQDSAASAVITDGAHRDQIESMRDQCDELELIIDCDSSKTGGYNNLLSAAKDIFEPLVTGADDPAFLIYTSGTTGPPKGALGAHRCLIGNLTGFELSQNFFPLPNDIFWTPADWAWTGGLLDALLPAWCLSLIHI